MKPLQIAYPKRTFAGISMILDLNKDMCPGPLWDELNGAALAKINGIKLPRKFIGLEQYPHDFMETKRFTYSALVEVEANAKQPTGIVSVTLPSGDYLHFEAALETLPQDIPAAYEYCQKERLSIEYGFDYEDYLPMEPGAHTMPVRVCLKLK
jgi:predicted transcriptional regulator YdeE